MVTSIVLALCVLLILLSSVHRDVLVRRDHVVRQVLDDARRLESFDSYSLMVVRGVRQIELACEQAAAASAHGAAEAERVALDVASRQAGTLVPEVRERLRIWRALLDGLNRAAPVMAPLRARELRLPTLRGVACVDAAAALLLSALVHLRLHLRLLDFGLGVALRVLSRLRAPLGARGRRRLAAAGADIDTLSGASIRAYISWLRSPTLPRQAPAPLAPPAQQYVM